MTLAIAIIGAVSGLISLALSLRAAWYDRPRLEVSAWPSLVESEAMSILIENTGRQPVTIGPVGYELDGEDWLLSEPLYREVLAPGASSRFDAEPAAVRNVARSTSGRPFVRRGSDSIYGKPTNLRESYERMRAANDWHNDFNR